jgi:hypothetical protein
MFVPLRVELGEDRFVVLRVLVDEAYEEFSFNLPGGFNPEEVIFNPRNAVLAEVEEENWEGVARVFGLAADRGESVMGRALA